MDMIHVNKADNNQIILIILRRGKEIETTDGDLWYSRGVFFSYHRRTERTGKWDSKINLTEFWKKLI